MVRKSLRPRMRIEGLAPSMSVRLTRRELCLRAKALPLGENSFCSLRTGDRGLWSENFDHLKSPKLFEKRRKLLRLYISRMPDAVASGYSLEVDGPPPDSLESESQNALAFRWSS